MTEAEIFFDHRDRLALYARLKDGVKDKMRLYEQLVLKPTRKLQWKLNTQRINATKGEE